MPHSLNRGWRLNRYLRIFDPGAEMPLAGRCHLRKNSLSMACRGIGIRRAAQARHRPADVVDAARASILPHVLFLCRCFITGVVLFWHIPVIFIIFLGRTQARCRVLRVRFALHYGCCIAQ